MPKWEIFSETVRYGWRRLWMVPNWSSSRRPERGPLEAFRQLRWCSFVWVCSYRHSRINVLAHGHLWKVFATHSHCFLSRRWSDPPWPWGSDAVRWQACPPITQNDCVFLWSFGANAWRSYSYIYCPPGSHCMSSRTHSMATTSTQWHIQWHHQLPFHWKLKFLMKSKKPKMEKRSVL